MAAAKGPRRPRAETPKGFRDWFGAEVTERNAMLARIAAVYDRWGFDALETSAVETVEALGKFLPDIDRPNAGVFAWQEEAVPGGGSGDWLALRYDMTAPLARVAAQYRNDLPTPYRRYAMGPVWRNEKPGPGRFRQFTQCDADTVGSASPASDAEIVAMLAEALEAAGIARGDYVVRVNDRRVLNGVLARMVPDSLADNDIGQSVVKAMRSVSEQHFSNEDILRTIDKFDKVGEQGVIELLTDGRKDASGAFIEGLGLFEWQATEVVAFLTSKGSTNTETLSNLKQLVGDDNEGVAALGAIASLLATMGLGEDRVIIDPSVVRGLGYYTGPVFEAELTFEILDDKGHKRQFGSVAGGGRYDDLVERFTGQKVPATGVSIGVDRLLSALRAKGRIGQDQATGPVVVTVMDRDRMGDYLAMANDLRAAGIRAEVYLGNPKNFGAQMKYADRRNSPLAIIQGSDEAARGVVQVKDLVLGAALAAGASLEEWKDRPAQAEVPRADLVARVRAMLEQAP
ncbi:MAG: histidine--tRNA ligase [Rubellimicrobium sp.]|nr:histidine--tRNA ligase [Rubellimicrobium sp.]